jgi:dUTP pyrophosphatase
MAKIYWARINSLAVIPTKRKEDAGLDIYGILLDPYLVLEPQQIHKFSTGLKSAFSDRYAVILKERGSTGTKGLQQRAGVFDSGFRGEWLVPIQNCNNVPAVFYNDKVITQEEIKLLPGMDNAIYYPMSKAICQAVMVKTPRVKCKEVSLSTLLKKVSKRMEGLIGSSGK